MDHNRISHTPALVAALLIAAALAGVALAQTYKSPKSPQELLQRALELVKRDDLSDMRALERVLGVTLERAPGAPPSIALLRKHDPAVFQPRQPAFYEIEQPPGKPKRVRLELPLAQQQMCITEQVIRTAFGPTVTERHMLDEHFQYEYEIQLKNKMRISVLFWGARGRPRPKCGFYLSLEQNQP